MHRLSRGLAAVGSSVILAGFIMASHRPPAQNKSEPASAETQYPFLIHAEMPLYPIEASLARISGTVQIEVTMKGSVVVNTKLKSGADQQLVTAALDNLKTWKWKFWREERHTFLITYVYELEKEESPFPENPRVEMHLPTFVKITARPPKPPCLEGSRSGDCWLF